VGLIKAPLFGENMMICRNCQRKMLAKNLGKARTAPLKNTGCVKIFEEVKTDIGNKIVYRGWA
jgi:hypothetical protein